LNEPANGSLRLFPDVVVQEERDDEWIAISRDPALIGETLVLDIALNDGDDGELRERFPVYVIDSQPVIVDGDVRHRIRLYASDAACILFEHQVRRG
jgi:hypothetical protein